MNVLGTPARPARAEPAGARRPNSVRPRSPDSATAADSGARGRIPPLLLDSLYVGSLLFSVPYLCCMGKGRSVVDHVRRRMRDIQAREGTRPCVWVHGVSVGEILSARHFLERLGEAFPQWEPVLSTSTRAGMDAGRRHYPEQRLIHYPFDLSYLVRRAFDRIRPDLIVIVEHELWPNFLGLAERRGVPVVMVNGRLSERSLRGYRLLSRWATWPPSCVRLICAEDETSARGFRELGVDPGRIRVTGNFKFDNAVKDASPQRMREDLGVAPDTWVLVGASTHKGEEAVLLDAFRRLQREGSESAAGGGSAQLVLAPRRVERLPELERLVKRCGFVPVSWSALKDSPAVPPARSARMPGDRPHKGRVILVDTAGELQRLSGAGDAVFVGGSLVPFGGHNVIEPASQGRPVLIGPNYRNFHTVVEALLGCDAIAVVKDGESLVSRLRELRSDRAVAWKMGHRAAQTVSDHAGASQRTLDALRPLLERRERTSESTEARRGVIG